MYFANSVYGSKQQQMFFLAKGYLPTYHNLALSFIYFAEDMRLVVGLPILLACLGLVYFTYKCLRKRQYAWLAIAALTLTPILFYVTSLYIGQASLILPEFAKAGAQYTISNVRYGIQILLAVGLFVAYLGARFRKIIPLLLLALVVQGVFFIKTNNVITYVDATRGLSSQAVSKGPDAPAAEAYMRSHYNGGLVLMDDYRNPIGIIESGVPMNEFIGSGNKPYWQESLDNPAKLASWVIVQKASTDYVWTHMKNKQILYDHFALVFQSGNIYIYHRRTTNPAFVEQAGQSLELQGIPFMLKGINSYDLLTQSDSVIKTTLSNTASSGFNTLRLWCFNKQGTMTAADFHNLDYILSEAHTYNIKLICTLGNALNNYGGIADFGASNAMQFFSSPQIIKNYEAYVTSVVSHISSITHKPYSQDSAIVAWELINEPRIEGDSNSQVLSSWIERVGEVLLSSDPNHLISPGTEGFMANAAQPEYDVGSHGSDIDTICSQEVVSLCSAHLYPKYLDGEQPTTTDIDTIIQQWRALGDQINKPLFLGEVGYDLSAVGSSQAQELLFMQSVATAVRDYKLNGALIWNIGDKSDNNFTLQYGNPNSTQVLGVWSNDL
jgi:hypothetical protein